jgi:hypothetical protein
VRAHPFLAFYVGVLNFLCNTSLVSSTVSSRSSLD